MAYTISKSSEQELIKAVKKFNSKIKRLEKSDRELDLPEKADIEIIKERIYDKRSLNREIDRLQRYSIRGMEDSITLESGATLSKYDYENLLKEQKRLSAKFYRTQRKLENITPTMGGKDLHYKVAEMGREDLSNVKAKRLKLREFKISKASLEDIGEFKELISAILRHERYDESIFIDNFTNQMILNLGYWAGADEDKLKHIRDKLSTLSEREFMKLYNSEEYIRAIKDYYNEINKKKITSEQIAKNMEKVRELYDELYKSIDKIVADYQ